MYKRYITVISNIILEPYYIPLMKKYFKCDLEIHFIPYGEYYEDEYKEKLANSNLIVVWLNFEKLFPDVFNHINADKISKQQAEDEAVVLYKRLVTDIIQFSNAYILSFSFEDFYRQCHIAAGYRYNNLVDQINIRLSEMLLGKATFIDFKRLIAEVGILNAYDQKGKYRWSAPYSKVLIESVVKEIHKQYLIEKGITKKCLVLDCDNVLWGGILSEDGIENIKLGKSGFGLPYQDFQRFVLSLYYHGVILAVSSKNDLSDILIMFREHSEMVLKEEHIACFQVNWKNKPDNIKQIAEILNISLDSMVFVDDSPVEVEAIKSMLPEVTAILYDRDSIYNRLACFNLKSNASIADIKKRNETYRTNQSREILKSQYDNYSEYIKALETKIDIHEALPIEYSRIAELTQRTNKCTNGNRYTVAEIKEHILRENIQLYSLSISDRFSDLGIVGALEVEDDRLNLFCLSCRALGRDIEKTMLEFIVGKHQLHKILFRPTGKNENIKSIFEQVLPNITFEKL